MRRWFRHLPIHGLPRQLPIDVGRAITAVVVSVLLYVFAANQTSAQATWLTSFTVPVDLVNVPSGLVATQAPPAVRLDVRATQQAFSQVQPSSFSAQVDASHAHAGDNQLPVAVHTTDASVTDVSADPPELTIHLDQIEQRVLPVQVQVGGQVPPGYQLGQPQATPESVTVTGASSLVEQATAAVINVNVQGATVSVNGVYTSSVVNAQGAALSSPNLTITPPSVSVSVPISQLTQYKEVGVQPVTQGVPAVGYVVDSITVDPPAATLVGSAAGLASASFVQTQPIDVSGVSTTVVRQVGLVPPAGSLLLQPSQTVTATVHVSPLQLTQTVRVTPSVINQDADVAVAAPPPPVALTITGPGPTLSALSGGDLQVVLDVAGKGPGQYQLTPQVQNLPDGMNLDSINPQQVAVTLVPAAPPSG